MGDELAQREAQRIAASYSEAVPVFNFFRDASDPEKIRNGLKYKVHESLLSCSCKDALCGLIDGIFNQILIYSSNRSTILPMLQIRQMLIRNKCAYTARDNMTPELYQIEDEILLTAEAMLSRTVGDQRERMLELFPGLVRVETNQEREQAAIQERPKRGLFSWRH